MTDSDTYVAKSCMPVAACVNKRGTRIVASSMAGPSEHIIHLYEEALHIDRSVSYQCSHIVPELSRCTALEISSNGNVCYLAGVSQSGKPRIVAVHNDLQLMKIASFDLLDKPYGKIRKMYRVRGYEILLIGGAKHIVILEFKNASFRRIAVVEDVHTSEITDLCMAGGIIYSKGFNESTICCTHFRRP